jgi:Ca2+/Na+ antiporter
VLEQIKRIFKGTAFALDALDYIALCFVASLIFFSVPFYVAKRLYKNDNVLLSAVITIFFVWSFIICIRDFKHKKWSALSVCVVSIWAVCALIAGWLLMF